MDSISEYSARRAAVQDYPDAAALNVQPYATEHVENLLANGKSALVDRQLLREARSSRVTDSKEKLSQRSPAFNNDAFTAGYSKFVHTLATAKVLKNSTKKLLHTGGKNNPVNSLSVENQAFATWTAILSATGKLSSPDSSMSVQSLAGRVAERLRRLTNYAPIGSLIGYETAGLVLLLHFCHATGWIEKRVAGKRFMSGKNEPSVFEITPKFRDEVLGGTLPADFSEYRPMLVRPIPWKIDTVAGGYISTPIHAIRHSNEPIQSPQIVNALNALQNTPFRINRKVLEIAGSFNRNAEEPDGKLIRGRYIEESFTVPDAVARSRTIRSALTISAARELMEEDEFYFPWNLDWRGRMYPATSIMSPQGSDLCKGLLEFADGTAIGKDGGLWLAVTLCNLAGADKAVIEQNGDYVTQTRTKIERVQWTLEHEEEILAVASDAIRNRAWHLPGGFGLAKIKAGKRVDVSVDKPWQFLAACYEWAEYREQGDGFKSRLAGAFDGSCSGVQMLAGMTRDASAGASVNLTFSERGDDYYGRMAASLTDRLCALVDTADAREMRHLEYWSRQTLDRDLLKLPSMTKVYSADVRRFGEQITVKTGADDMECMWLANQVDLCFKDVVPGMLDAMEYLQKVAKVVSKFHVPLNWTTPAGLHVTQKKTKEISKQTDIPLYGENHRHLFNVRTDVLCPRQQKNGVSPNFVHGVDASHMVRTINTLYARGVRNFWMIHDSFGAPFAHCNDVYEVTRDEFVMLMSDDLLANWTRDVTACLDEESKKKLPPLPARGNLDLGEVRNSLYAWF